MSLIGIYVRVIGQLRPEGRLAILISLANVALAVASFAEPILFGRIIDVLTSRPMQGEPPVGLGTLMPLVVAWVGFGLFTILAGVFTALHADRLAHRRRLAVMAGFFEHVLQLSLGFHNQNHSGRILKVMLEGASAMFVLWLGFFRDHFAALIALGILLPLTVFINWRLALLLIVLVAVFALMTAYVLRRTEKLQGSVESYHTGLAQLASDALGNIPVVQSFTRVDAETRALRDMTVALMAAQTPVLSWWAIASMATRASATLTVTAIFLLGVTLHFQDLASVGEIVSFMSLATMLTARLDQVVSFLNGLFLQAPKMADFFNILDTLPQVADRPHPKRVERFAGRVEFDGVTFSYRNDSAAIVDVTFAAEPGETIALVGATGSGKSTTLGLMPRAFDPQRGEIRIDGEDIRDLALADLRRNIGVVFQEPMLFARSIRENLLVGRAGASDAEMLEALDRAQASDFISRHPEGLDTVLGERGRSLSGGERQRLSIARALLKDPPILILDEATSALDASTERKLQLALEEVMKGRTTFVIAHRLATVRNADRILVFEHGRIIETGTFVELVAHGHRFAELARAQFIERA